MSTEHTDPQTTQTILPEQFESFEIPPNIDPRLLALWLQREKDERNRKNLNEKTKHSSVSDGRKLNRLFAAYVGIVVMCFVIILGLIQGKEPDEILIICCRAFVIYAIIGFIAGGILEHSIRDSAETLLREIVRRSDSEKERRQEEAMNQPPLDEKTF